MNTVLRLHKWDKQERQPGGVVLVAAQHIAGVESYSDHSGYGAPVRLTRVLMCTGDKYVVYEDAEAVLRLWRDVVEANG